MNSRPPAVPPQAHARPLDVLRVGALFCLVLSIAGLVLSISLSVTTFKAAYTPCLLDLAVCPVDDVSCIDTQAPTGVGFLGLPFSVWAASIYVLTGVLALKISRRSVTSDEIAPQLLFLLAFFSLLVSVVLGAYSLLASTSRCSFCMSLYVVSFLLVVGAQITRNPPGIDSSPKLPALWRRLADTLDLGFILAVIFIVATGVQSMTYHGLRNAVDARVGCSQVLATWPSTALVLGTQEPRVIISLFVDMTHRGSGDDFKGLASALYEGKFSAPVQIRLYHTPREICDPSGFPAGYAKTNESARADGACLAAQAAECMEKLRPQSGIELVGGMFALHDDRQAELPLFTKERIQRRAVELGLLRSPAEEAAFLACLDNDQNVLAQITAHQLHAAGPEYTLPMRVIHRASGGAPDMRRAPRWAAASVPLPVIMQYVTSQAQDDAAP